MKKTTGKKTTTAPPDHRMTRKERGIVEEVAGRIVANATPRLKVNENKISVDHPDRFVGEMLMMKALGTANTDFTNGILRQLANVPAPSDKEPDLNFCMSVITGIEPRDQIETMLASQMAVIHSAVMRAAGYLARAETLVETESAERTLNKLVRSFTALVEALKRHRAADGQIIAVQNNVSVRERDHAIIDNVTTNVPADKSVVSPAAIPDARVLPMVSPKLN
jgi:hypothetical protein